MLEYQWRTILAYWPDYAHAAILALQITVIGFALAFVVASAAAMARRSRSSILRIVATSYVEVIRNTPVLLQIFIVYFSLPSVGIRLSAVVAGTVALGINVGAYLTEVLRAGIASVGKGQLEAAQVLGLKPTTVLLNVVAPQALQNVWPALVNNLIQVLLGTSLLSTIAVPELTGVATVVNARTLLFVQAFGIAIAVYLTMSYGLSLVAAGIQRLAFSAPRNAPPRRLRGSRLPTVGATK